MELLLAKTSLVYNCIFKLLCRFLNDLILNMNEFTNADR